MTHHQLLPLLMLFFSLSLLTRAQPEPSATTSCTSDFYALEKELLSRTGNRYNLTKTFSPPRDAHPVVVKVTYVFEGSDYEDEVWFWTESLFYLIQPLEIFQYTSLFFSNLPYRQKEVVITFGANCSDIDPEYLMILTQRVSHTNILTYFLLPSDLLHFTSCSLTRFLYLDSLPTF